MLMIILSASMVFVSAEESVESGDNVIPQEPTQEEIDEEVKSLADKFEEIVAYIISGLLSLGVSGSVIMLALQLLKGKLSTFSNKVDNNSKSTNDVQTQAKETNKKVEKLEETIKQLIETNNINSSYIKQYLYADKERDEKLTELLKENFSYNNKKEDVTNV
jgi:negative regulator of replication initiation